MPAKYMLLVNIYRLPLPLQFHVADPGPGNLTDMPRQNYATSIEFALLALFTACACYAIAACPAKCMSAHFCKVANRQNRQARWNIAEHPNIQRQWVVIKKETKKKHINTQRASSKQNEKATKIQKYKKARQFRVHQRKRIYDRE